MKNHLRTIKSQLRLELPDDPSYGAKSLQKDDSLLHDAKRLHASVYLKHDYISVDEVDEDGKIKLESDPHQSHADYFVIVDKVSDEVLATARQIRTLHGHSDLPIMDRARLKRRHKRRLNKKSHQTMIEISGLAKASGVPSVAVIELYRAMWQYSGQQGHDYWLMACDVKLYRKLRVLFGRNIQRIGRRTSYQGGDVVPCVLDLSKGRKFVAKNIKSHHPLYKNIRRTMAEFFKDKP